MHRVLMACGVAAGPFFIVVSLLEGALRPGYDSQRQPISALAMGPRGWIQRANFFITGALALTCAFGLPSALRVHGGSAAAASLIGLFGLGLLGSGIYTTDITGLDSAKPTSKPRTRDGVIHDLFALPICAGLSGACGVLGTLFFRAKEAAWAWYAVVSGVLFLALFVFAGAGFAGQRPFSRVGGLLQRAAVVVGWTWFSLSTAHILAAG